MRFSFLTGLSIIFAIPFAVLAHPGKPATTQVPWQEASGWPDRIVATIEDDPATSISVSWRTDASVMSTRAQIALARGDARFDQENVSVDAQTERLDLTMVSVGGLSFEVSHNQGLPQTHHHSVRFDGLKPDTLYGYRVQGAEGQWSEWFQTRTAPLSGPVRFIYFGDAQNGLSSHWPRVIRAAFQKAPDARFILHAGDLVNRGSRDLEWAHWFRAGGFIHGMIPAIAVTGNHEYDDYELTAEEEVEPLSILWRPQFRLPVEEDLSEELHETVYSIRYSPDLEVFVLNTNIDDLSEQAQWLDARLSASDARWRVVSMHHPVFSSGRGRDSAGRRAVLLPILLKHEVDLVLQGHDHTYARGTLPSLDQVPNRTARTGDGTIMSMFVNSVSGSKQYEFNEDGWDKYEASGVMLDRRGENTQFFQVIEIDKGMLHYAAYSADGTLYDEFRLSKAADGAKSIMNNSELPQERRFENTLPYEGVQE